MRKQIVYILLGVLAVTALGSDNTAAEDQTFQRACNQCHSVNRILYTKKTTTGWKKTVDWMQRKGNFSDKEAKEIKQHLKALFSSYAEELYKTKCSKCHALNVIAARSRTKEQWAALVNQERSRAVSWIALDEARDIANYLTENYAQKNKAPGFEIRALTEQKCLRCHLPKTVFKTDLSAREWKSVNNRMQQKSPQWITEQQLQKITQHLSDRAGGFD